MTIEELREAIEHLSEVPEPTRRIELLREALSLAQQQEMIAAEAEYLRLLANAWQEAGQLAKAHIYRTAAAGLIKGQPEAIPRQVHMRVFGDLGRTEYEACRWPQAEAHFQRAFDIARELADDEARCLYRMNLGLCWAHTVGVEKAREVGEEIVREAESKGYHRVLGLQHVNLAALSLSADRLNDTQRHARQALACATQLGDPLLRANAASLIERAYQAAALVTGRHDYGGQASRWADGASSVDPLVTADRARVYERGGKVDEALREYESALESYERSRKGLGYEQFQLSYFRSVQPLYEHVAELLLRAGEPDQAFLTGERLRSRLLLDRLGAAAIAAAGPPDHRERELLSQYFGERVRVVAPNSTRGRRGARSRPAEAAPAAGAVGVAAEFLAMYEQRCLREGSWSKATAAPLVEWSEAQAMLRPGDALLTYLVTDETTAIFVATSERRHFQHLNYGAEVLHRDVTDLTQAIDSLLDATSDPTIHAACHGRAIDAPWPELVQRPLGSVLRLLTKLYTVLIAPVLPMIHSRPHWIIAPFGPLHRVPWAALRGAGRYVVESHAVSVLPSVSVGATLEKQRRAATGAGACFFGDPDEGHALWGLPGAAREVEACASLVTDSRHPLIGFTATKAEFLARAPDAGVLHLACHHLFDMRAPLLSFVKLARSGAGALYAFEVMEMRLSALLVVLSACGSGESTIETGDEQMGMVRAFLAAGARSVLSTLWRLDDDSPAILFPRFYALACDADLPSALAQAQRDLLRHPLYQLPCFWAALQLSGDWKGRLGVRR